MSIVLEARDVVRAYGDRPVLKATSLALEEGTVTALLGPSGSGKSTLLRVLAGLDDLEAGTVLSQGQVLSSPGNVTPPEKRNLGMVFQDFALFPHLSALENIAFGLSHLPRTKQQEKAKALLEMSGLSNRADAHPFELSGGEQQRIAIARALAREPAAVLLDEPFSNLDSSLRRTTRDHAMGLLHASGAAVLLVTHDVEEALSLADTLALMSDGQIIQTGTPESVYMHPTSARAAQLTGDINVWRGHVLNGQVETPFGKIATDQNDGDLAEVLVRPEAISITAPGNIKILDRRTRGATVEVTVEADAVRWRARAGHLNTAQQGDLVSVSLDPSLISIVPAQS